MRRLLFIALTLFLIAPLLAGAESNDAFYPVPESPAEVRAADEARLTDLGFLAESNSDDAYSQAVREFQRYLKRLSEDTPAEGLPATTPEVLDEQKEDASRALSIKPLTTYSKIDAIEAFKAYTVVDNEGELYALTTVFLGVKGFKTPYLLGWVDFPKQKLRFAAQIDYDVNKADKLKTGQKLKMAVDVLRTMEDGKEVIGYKYKPVGI
jgi:hypothetical protein